jgi:uncharacterized membrane protein YesL
MQFRSVKGNIAYALLLFVVIFGILYIDLHFRKQASLEFHLMPRFIFISFGYPIIGAMIGMPSVWKQFGRKDPWRVNIPRLVFLALPAFVMANFVLLTAWFGEIIEPVLLKYTTIFVITDTSTYIFQVLFGFILITSFYRGKKHGESS